MKRLFLSILLNCLCCFAFSQSDQFQYFNKNWKSVPKDSAYYYSVISSADGFYQRKDFVSASEKLHMDGVFSDREMKTRDGITKWYYENGSLRDSILFDNGKRIAGWFFYENGNKKAAFSRTDGKVTEQRGWDENGNEIRNYIIERAAEFPGGMEGWKRYLEKNLNANVPSDAKAPYGNYTVRIAFKVNENGKVTDVNTISFPPACPQCAVEGIRVMQKGPDWLPRIEFGKPVVYKGVQSITFQVARN